MSAPKPANGFTLIEMLVALAIFSLAALALLRLEGATVKNTGLLQEQAVAQIVARNIAVETITDEFVATVNRLINQQLLPSPDGQDAILSFEAI